jgi:transcriptional regulator with XRE-family HTH domain
MWNENLKDYKKKTGLTTKQIAEKSNLPERTVSRIFSGDTDNPYMTTLIPIVNVLGGSLDDLFADTKVVVSTETVVELQEAVEEVKAEKNLVVSDYELLLDKYTNLEKELEKTKTELAYTKKLLAVHEYYTKLKCE